MISQNNKLKGFLYVSAEFMVEERLVEDFEEVAGCPFLDTQGKCTYEHVMIMELLWWFDNYLDNTTTSDCVLDFNDQVDRRKEFGLVSIIQDYLPEFRKEALWKYYYRRVLERDVANRVWFL